MEELTMNRYEEGMKLIEESCGNKKDNTIALSTITTEPGADGFLRPRACLKIISFCSFYPN